MTIVPDHPLVLVVLSVHRPDPALFHPMLASLQRQEGVRLLLCAVLDGGAAGLDPGIVPALAAAGAHVIESPEQLGVRGAFAHGLAAGLALAAGQRLAAVAFADQDDVWHDGKLARCLAHLGPGVALVHSDARVVADSGAVVAPSLRRFERREANDSLLDHLVLNEVSGMATVMTPEAAGCAVALMADLPSAILHDHVAALAAVACGRVVRLDAALVDYVQHEANAVGAVARGGPRSWRGFWLFNLRAYQAQSLAIFRDRRQLVLHLAGQGVDLGPDAELFLAGRVRGRLALMAAYTRVCLGYFFAGQFRHWRMMMRLGIVAVFWRRQALAET